jgi:hypothetical protein
MYIANLDPDSRGNRIDECDAIETSNKKAAPSFQGRQYFTINALT